MKYVTKIANWSFLTYFARISQRSSDFKNVVFKQTERYITKIRKLIMWSLSVLGRSDETSRHSDLHVLSNLLTSRMLALIGSNFVP